MADIDDELLALAGDASSDEEEEQTSKDIGRENSASSHGGSAKASAKKSNGRRSKGQDDSEEEGEASDASDGDAPMEESDSESDIQLDDETDKYPLEGKYINSADKREIMAMPEIKREEILAERAQEAEKLRQNRALRQMLSARESEARKQDKKRKAGAADLDADQRKTSRQRTKLGGGKVGEASTGIDSLKRARAEKNDRQRRREEDKERHKDRRTAQEEYSDADADGDSEVEWDDAKSRNKKKSVSPDYRDAEPAGLHDIERVRVGRSRFALVCFYPGFDEAITGTFVRISVGVDKETGQNIYRMAVVKGFVEDRPYAIETANGKLVKTTQYIRAAHGKAERNWPFITCSDSPFTEAEWNRYKQTCLVESVPLPTKPKLAQKIADINALVNRTWTEAELQEKLLKSGALVNKYAPLKRNQLTNAIKEAKATNDLVKAEELQKELDELDGPKLAYSTSMRSSPKKPQQAGGLSQQDRLAVLNKANRRRNAEEVRQAQINERKAARSTEAAIARGEDVTEDHSRRVKTRAKFKHDVSEGLSQKKTDDEASGANTPSGTPKLSAKKSTSLPHLAKLQAANGEKKGLPTLSRPLMDDDIIGAIDLGIDIDIDI